jgi:hypothetical protein
VPTGHDISKPPDSAADTATVAPGSASRYCTDAAHIDGEAALRDWEGLPLETNILVPTFTTPMRLPAKTWALLVQAVDMTGDVDHGEELEIFAGGWLADQPPADLCDGDLVVRMTPPDDTVVAVDLEMLLAQHSRWRRVATWLHLGSAWPVIVAPTAATVMRLSTDVVELSARHDMGPATPLVGSARGAVGALLDAKLVKPGEEFLWIRRNTGARHTARIRADGAFVLADGRVFATPSGAATALCGYDQNGWGVFQRVSDGRTLAGLRSDLRMRRG